MPGFCRQYSIPPGFTRLTAFSTCGSTSSAVPKFKLPKTNLLKALNLAYHITFNEIFKKDDNTMSSVLDMMKL